MRAHRRDDKARPGRPERRPPARRPAPPAVPGLAETVLDVQRRAGNAVATAMVQRDAAPAPDHLAAAQMACDLVNKNSLLKLKVPVKFPGAPRLWPGLELKKVELEIDVQGTAVGTGGGHARTRVSGGRQGVGSSEVDAASGRLTQTQATVYAMELERKFASWGPEAARSSVSFKGGAEYGEYRPENSTVPSKQETKVRLALAVDTPMVYGEVGFIPITFDKTRTGPDRWKFATVKLSVGTGKDLSKTFPHAMTIGPMPVDITGRLRINGSVEIGPDYKKAYEFVLKMLGREEAANLLKSAAPAIAREESMRFVERYAAQMADELTRDIADENARAMARQVAERKITEEIDRRALVNELADRAGPLLSAQVPETARMDIFALRTMAEEIVAKTARPAVSGLAGAIRFAVKEAISQLTIRSLARQVALALVPGPIDFVFAGAQLLYGYWDTIVKAEELRTVGLRVQAIRENYVAGYVGALRATAEGAGQSAGPGNEYGAAYLAGVRDGTQQLNAIVDRQLATSPGEDRQLVLNEVAHLMGAMPVDRTAILAAVAPKLKEALFAAYERAHTGLFERLFGGDVRDSHDFELFAQAVEHQLGRTTTANTTVAHLANGVVLTLVMLDATGDLAQRFRTLDGKHTATLTGDTSTHSGWVAEDGRPLEELYPSQESADQAAADQSAFGVDMRQRLSNSSLTIELDLDRSGGSRVSDASLHAPSDDLSFAEFLRSPAAQGLTVAGAGCRVVVETKIPLAYATSLVIHAQGSAVRSQIGTDPRQFPDFAEWARRNFPSDEPSAITLDRIAGHVYTRFVSGRTLASLPHLG